MHGQQAPCRPRGLSHQEQLMLCDMACRTNEGVVLKAPDHVVRGHFAQDQLSTARLTTHRPHALPRRSTRNRYYKHGPTCGVVIATLWICRGVPPCQPILCQMRCGRRLPWLLRVRRERPGGNRAAEKRDEVASCHSITSSAVARSVGGTSRPSALAVCWLMTSSNRVGCNTGRSPGFSPLSIRPM